MFSKLLPQMIKPSRFLITTASFVSVRSQSAEKGFWRSVRLHECYQVLHIVQCE